MSDEKREGVVALGVNLRNWSSIDDFVEELIHRAIEPEFVATVAPAAKDLPADPSPARLLQHLEHALPARIEEHLRLFLHGLQRRLERDLERVFDYYEGLRRESIARLQRPNADAARERLRIEAVVREYQAKIADLRQKYDLRVAVELGQTLDLAMPVERCRAGSTR